MAPPGCPSPAPGQPPRFAYFAKVGPVQLQEKGTAPLVTRTPAAQRRQLSAQRVSAGEAPLEKRAPSGGRHRTLPEHSLRFSPAGVSPISRFLLDLPLHHLQLATKIRDRSLGSGLRVRAKTAELRSAGQTRASAPTWAGEREKRELLPFRFEAGINRRRCRCPAAEVVASATGRSRRRRSWESRSCSSRSELRDKRRGIRVPGNRPRRRKYKSCRRG